MRRIIVLAVLTLGLAFPGVATPHPLGNFSVNTYLRAEASGSELYVRYVVDRAEIPTVREQDRITAAGGLDAYAVAQARTLLGQIDLSVDGKRQRLEPVRQDAVEAPGAAGLTTLRIGVWYRVVDPPAGGTVTLRDANFAGRVGWREALVRESAGAAAEGASTTTDRSNELRSYPDDLRTSPLDARDVTFAWSPGTGPAQIPGFDADELPGEAGDGFVAGLLDDDLSFGVVLFALLLAAGWGAAHALSPGHGKSMIAAYLIGSRGTSRHAFILAAFVTITHTISVIALGLVTLWLSALILPETVFAWINLAIGAWVAWLRLGPVVRRRAHERAHQRGDHHQHHHHDRHHGGAPHHHDHRSHGHAHDDHGHSHAPPADLSMRGLAVAGVSAGLLPCPSAMVLMLGAISLGHVAYGLVLVLAFSLGLAGVLAGIGLLFLYARRFMERLPMGGRVAAALPVASAVVIVGLGVALTTRAIPGVF
jgi:ABC-type nickel/cobalt efflux system permease component RcnA